MISNDLKAFDADIATALKDEIDRQEDKLELIASENFVSRRVLGARDPALVRVFRQHYPVLDRPALVHRAAL